MPFALAISCGSGHTVMVDRAGRVFSCGLNEFGQLGRRDKKTKSFVACSLPLGAEAMDAHCGPSCTIVNTAAGLVLVTGTTRQVDQIKFLEEKFYFSFVCRKLDGLEDDDAYLRVSVDTNCRTARYLCLDSLCRPNPRSHPWRRATQRDTEAIQESMRLREKWIQWRGQAIDAFHRPIFHWSASKSRYTFFTFRYCYPPPSLFLLSSLLRNSRRWGQSEYIGRKSNP